MYLSSLPGMADYYSLLYKATGVVEYYPNEITTVVINRSLKPTAGRGSDSTCTWSQ